MRRRRSKYGAVPTVVDGLRFHSKAEARRWLALKQLERSGAIKHLQRQTPVDVTFDGEKLFRWYADFTYFEDGKRIYEDVKGVETAVFKLKAKILRAIMKIHVRITKA